MKIHHAVVKKAEKLGFQLASDGDRVTATLPRRAVSLHGTSPNAVMEDMSNFIQIDRINDTFKIYDTDGDGNYRLIDAHGLLLHAEYLSMKGLVALASSYEPGSGVHPDKDPDDNFPGDTGADGDTDTDDLPVSVVAVADGQSIMRSTTVKHNGVGVPLDGAIAYSEGVMTADNPHPEGSDEAEEWYTAWDEAADARAEEDDEKSGSVVSDRYRQLYREKGHPTHCGDWLATTLNNLVANKKGTNLDLFEHICKINGVDTSKYKRDGRGWEGRLRMTGRNLLAKAVYKANGQLKVPQGEEEEILQAPKDWMEMQRFKTAKPVAA